MSIFGSLDNAEASLTPPSLDTLPPPASIGSGELPAWFEVSDLAVDSIGAAGAALAAYARDVSATEATGLTKPALAQVDRRLAGLWFGFSIRPMGWSLPSPWDAIAGDYATRDGWIKLHTNVPAHATAARSVLGPVADRDATERAVASWDADALESAVVAAGGCAATMRGLEQWQQHPQGIAVAAEPLIAWQQQATIETQRAKPLSNIRILDLTRVLAGPVAGRFLAAYGAQVLRIDPPHWDEPGVIPEVSLGKRCAGLDLNDAADREKFAELAAHADVLLHGYRPGALTKLGLDAETLRSRNQALIDVCLNAYGWSGPWRNRRGFDSLVQMSCGIADYGMRGSGNNQPTPLPVQALDHATGYCMAAAVLNALRARAATGAVYSARLSLARTAFALSATKRSGLHTNVLSEQANDIDPQIEDTAWGPAQRIKFPLRLAGTTASWAHPAAQLRSSSPTWLSSNSTITE